MDPHEGPTPDDPASATPTHSGSRWEPHADEPTTETATPVPSPTTDDDRPRGRRRTVLSAVAAVAAALVIGAGGFVLGHATAGPGPDGPPGSAATGHHGRQHPDDQAGTSGTPGAGAGQHT
jgi:hypothetical protein